MPKQRPLHTTAKFHQSHRKKIALNMLPPITVHKFSTFENGGEAALSNETRSSHEAALLCFSTENCIKIDSKVILESTEQLIIAPNWSSRGTGQVSPPALKVPPVRRNGPAAPLSTAACSTGSAVMK